MLAATVWYELFAGFHFYNIYFLQFPKQNPLNLFLIPDRKKCKNVNTSCNSCFDFNSSFQGPVFDKTQVFLF